MEVGTFNAIFFFTGYDDFEALGYFWALSPFLPINYMITYATAMMGPKIGADITVAVHLSYMD